MDVECSRKSQHGLVVLRVFSHFVTAASVLELIKRSSKNDCCRGSVIREHAQLNDAQ